MGNTADVEGQDIMEKMVDYWRSPKVKITSEFNTENMSKWSISSGGAQYALFAVCDNQILTSQITPVKRKGAWTLMQLEGDSEAAPYIYELTAKGLVDRAQHQFKKSCKEADSLRRKGKGNEGEAVLLDAREQVDSMKKNGKKLESIFKREYRFEKPLIFSPEETVPIARVYLESLFPQYSWTFEGYGPVNFDWYSKNCIAVSKNDSAVLESCWSRIENGIRISLPVRIGVNVVDGKVHFVSLPMNVITKSFPDLKAVITPDKVIEKSREAFLRSGGLFDRELNIENSQIKRNMEKKEALFDRYFSLVENDVKLRFKYADRNYFAKEDFEKGAYDPLHRHESKNSFLKDVLIYECRIRHKKQSYCGTDFEFFIDAQTGEVISSHYKDKGLPENSKYLQVYYQEVNPEIVRGKYYDNNYAPYSEIYESLRTELGVKKSVPVIQEKVVRKEY